MQNKICTQVDCRYENTLLQYSLRKTWFYPHTNLLLLTSKLYITMTTLRMIKFCPLFFNPPSVVYNHVGKDINLAPETFLTNFN